MPDTKKPIKLQICINWIFLKNVFYKKKLLKFSYGHYMSTKDFYSNYSQKGFRNCLCFSNSEGVVENLASTFVLPSEMPSQRKGRTQWRKDSSEMKGSHAAGLKVPRRLSCWTPQWKYRQWWVQEWWWTQPQPSPWVHTPTLSNLPTESPDEIQPKAKKKTLT